MAQDKVQLKREEVVGNDVVMQDINPKTKTNSITDSTKGVPLDQTLAMIKNMINNKLSRVVNSVNGRTGVVILDAGDVGLENVDNISFGDIKRWVIEYIGDIFGTKRIILKEYLSEIHTIIGTNDKAYADTPFYCEKGAEDVSDYMAYIGYIYWDAENELLKEEHLQVKVVGFTDKSLRYNVANTQYANGGLGVNIWKGEDALKVMNNAISYSGYTKEDMDNSGLYIDKSKVVPNVYFFDGVYGTLTGSGDNMHNENALVYWTTDPSDTTEGNLPIIEIYVNDVTINKASSGGGTVNTLHTAQPLKEGDIIITNFSYANYFNPDAVYINETYPKIIDALTCRQPAMGRVVQGATEETDNTYIVKFYTMRPNVSHGLKLIPTNTYHLQSPADTTIGLDLMTAKPVMSDDTTIYDMKTNISGINAMDQYVLNRREPERPNIPKKICTVFPTGKSANILDQSDGKIPSSSAYIMPNFSMCVIPGYIFVNHGYGQGIGKIKNWNPSAPIDYDDTTVENVFGRFNWNMIGLNLEKMIFDPTQSSQVSYARNISGLRINNDEEFITEAWLGHGSGSTKIVDLHSGGVSVNVGDFLGIGTAEEIADTSYSDRENYYDEGKVNVRIDKMKGLYGVAGNKLAINIADGRIYQPDLLGARTSTWLEGGLKFLPSTDIAPDQGPLTVNTGSASSGLNVKNNFLVEPKTYRYGTMRNYLYESNVLAVQPTQLSKTLGSGTYLTYLDKNPLEVVSGIKEEDIAHLIPTKNICVDKIWGSFSEMINDQQFDRFPFNDTKIYVAGGEKYLYWLDSGQPTFDKYFVFYWDRDDYDIIMDAMTTGIIPDIPSATYIKPIDVLRRQCHVLIEPKDPTTNPSEYTITATIYEYATDDLRFPDFDNDGKVDGTEASSILRFNAYAATAFTIYSNSGHTSFYNDPELTDPVIPVAGYCYIDHNEYLADPNAPGHEYYMTYLGTQDTPSSTPYLKKYEFAYGIPATLQDYMYADVNRSGHIDPIDASAVLRYYSNCSSGAYPGMIPTESWRKFLRDEMGINVEPGNGSCVTIAQFNYNKGLRIRYNELKGLTTNTEYIGSVNLDTEVPKRAICEATPDDMLHNDMINSLSIKIADPTSGMFIFDSTRAGGLRFGTDGYLGVRVNNKNNFSSIFPNRNGVLSIDELNTGSHGLRIYGLEENDKPGMNVLGIQLTEDGKLDNGELKIDSKGCLRLSSEIGNMKTLKFKYGNTEIPYDGSEDLTIVLGPGLCITGGIG